MFKNYFYLLRASHELNILLKDKIISDIFSQEKNVLFLNVSNESSPFNHLILSANQNFPYIYLKDEHHKAKKNVAELYQNFLPAKIISVGIASNDRIIKISTDKFNLFLTIRGNNTNIIIEDKFDNYFPFTKSKFNFSKVLQKADFISTLEFDIEDENFQNISELKKRYPQISPEIRDEIIFRMENKLSTNYSDCLQKIINEILFNDICIKYIPDLQKTKLLPSGFNIFKNINCKKKYSDFNSSFTEYIKTYYRNKKRDTLSNELNKYLSTNLAKLSNKLNNLHNRVEQGSRENEYRLIANILQANRHLLKQGLKEIKLTNYETGEEILIRLDPKLSVNKNIDRYFEKSRDEKINYKKSLDLFNFTKEKYEELIFIKQQFEAASTIQAIEEIHKKIFTKKVKSIKMETGHKFKYWHYLIEDKFNVFVGRDSKSNDYLSLKFSHQNDYWFHARGLPGSHVILRVENKKEGMPKDVIKKAASIAAFYSKAKTAGTAPVSYTFAKFVHKKKGMLPGKVLLSKENTILVKPGIPKNCILVNE